MCLDGPLSRGEPAAGRYREENLDFLNFDNKEWNPLKNTGSTLTIKVILINISVDLKILYLENIPNHSHL